jgi:hypothetical protein
LTFRFVVTTYYNNKVDEHARSPGRSQAASQYRTKPGLDSPMVLESLCRMDAGSVRGGEARMQSFACPLITVVGTVLVLSR